MVRLTFVHILVTETYANQKNMFNEKSLFSVAVNYDRKINPSYADFFLQSTANASKHDNCSTTTKPQSSPGQIECNSDFPAANISLIFFGSFANSVSLLYRKLLTASIYRGLTKFPTCSRFSLKIRFSTKKCNASNHNIA